ncbi:MAG: hypothetical protein HOP96_08590 [Sphingomonas sp.]|nr:hypothetical protein [Sphingomonas sp.]
MSRALGCYDAAMSQFPIVIRNRVVLFYRGFMLAFVGTVALVSYAALRDGPPEPGRWWPLIILLFWTVGLAGLAWSLNQETSVVRILGNRSIQVERGKAFRRHDLWTDRARFWIEETKDSDGDPYFKLMMDAPGEPLAVREGHQRPVLERLQSEVEEALRR